MGAAATTLRGAAGETVQASRRARRGWIVTRSLVVADLVGLLTAFAAAEAAVGGGGRQVAASGETAVFLASLPFWIVAAKLYELYDRDEEYAEHSTLYDLRGVFHLVTVGAWLLLVFCWATGVADPSLAKLTAFWALAVASVTGARAVARGAARRSSAYRQNTVILGAGAVGQLVARKLLQHREYGLNVIGFVDAAPLPLRPDVEELRVLGPPTTLPDLVARENVERVVIAFSRDDPDALADLLGRLAPLDVQIDIVPRLFDVIGPNVVAHSVESLPLLGLPAAKRFPFSCVLKRLLDVVLGSLLLVLTAPLAAAIAVAIRRDSPGPVLFRQPRLGEGMREFSFLKFRTMRVDVDDSSHRDFIRSTMSAAATPHRNGIYKLDRSDAVTRVGRFLRRTSLDELPQLVNVVRGEMSLVGPRPCLRYETEFFEPHHFERFRVPAGITGLWQVTARAHSSFGEALDMDVAYARNWSLGLDLRLLLLTPFQLIRQRKATA